MLYVQAAIRNNIQVIDIPKSIGDVYRDEEYSDYVNKIQKFNQNIIHKYNKFLKNNVGKFILR